MLLTLVGSVNSQNLFFLMIILYAFTLQPTSPVRAEIDVKLGGTQCNIIMSRLKPWLQVHYSKKKKMVLREEIHAPVKSQSTASKAIMWTCTVSAPEMTIVLYSINGLPLYHVSDARRVCIFLFKSR